jgi:hypothetical protein
MNLNWRSSGRPGDFEARTEIGIYKLMVLPLGCSAAFHSHETGFFDINSKPGVSLEQAKELAEKDYAARRLATLERLRHEDPRLKSGFR